MSTLDVRSDVFNQGVQKLKLLAKHGETVLQIYYQNSFDEQQLTQNAVSQLLDADILWRGDDEHASLKLSEPVAQLISHLLKDEKRRKANTDIGEFHENIRHLVGQITHALQQGQQSVAQHSLNRLQQEVDDLNSRLSNGINSLWHRLNTGFAFVDNLSDKVYENEKASLEVSRWLSGLEQIDFNELIRLAGHNAQLRNILVRHLQLQVSDHLNNLLEVQKRLGILLASFRQQHERNQLVRSVLLHFSRHPQAQVSDYAQRTNISDLVNRAAALPPQVAISTDRHQDEDTLRQLIRLLPAKKAATQAPNKAQQAIVLEESPLIVAERRALKDDVSNFFVYAYQQDNGSSALQYLQQHALKWSAEIWLYQVIAEYQALNAQERQWFTLQYQEQAVSAYNDVLLVHDLKLYSTAANA